jgi:NADP-dependent 3-hydroxy acid dehydrogenase YdfG
MEKKVVLITGASSGIGKETAKLLVENGHIVYGAARRLDKMNDLKEAGIKLLEMDVTNDESMVKEFKKLLKQKSALMYW